MTVFTLSKNYIDSISEDNLHLTNILMQFPNPLCGHKASMDKSKKLLSEYTSIAGQSHNIFTWLDLMSRDNFFEIIDVIIPDNIPEEEIYMLVAQATRPEKNIIVNSHQYYAGFNYIPNSNSISYNEAQIKILDRNDFFKVFKSNSEQSINNEMGKGKKNSLWINGLFFIFSIIMIFGIVSLAAYFLPVIICVPVFIVAIIIFVLLSSFLLKSNDQLKEKSLKEIITMSFENLRLLTPMLKTNGRNDEKKVE